jgi:hypothetical protein
MHFGGSVGALTKFKPGDQMQPTKPKPALVYANPSARDDVSDYLLSHNWYRLDDLQENETDLIRPSAERPILRRVMLYASNHGAAETTLVEDDAFQSPEVFVTDDLTTLGMQCRIHEVHDVHRVGDMLQLLADGGDVAGGGRLDGSQAFRCQHNVHTASFRAALAA